MVGDRLKALRAGSGGATADQQVGSSDGNPLLARALLQRSRERRQSRAELAQPDPAGAQRNAERALGGADAALPHGEPIQKAFGRHDVRDVRANENCGRPVALGERVGFSGSPDLHTAAHEAAHVVQQRRGAGAGPTLEQHADAVADGVVQGGNVEALLDGVGGDSGAGAAVAQHLHLRPKDIGGRFKIMLPGGDRTTLATLTRITATGGIFLLPGGASKQLIHEDRVIELVDPPPVADADSDQSDADDGDGDDDDGGMDLAQEEAVPAIPMDGGGMDLDGQSGGMDLDGEGGAMDLDGEDGAMDLDGAGDGSVAGAVPAIPLVSSAAPDIAQRRDARNAGKAADRFFDPAQLTPEALAQIQAQIAGPAAKSMLDRDQNDTIDLTGQPARASIIGERMAIEQAAGPKPERTKDRYGGIPRTTKGQVGGQFIERVQQTDITRTLNPGPGGAMNLFVGSGGSYDAGARGSIEGRADTQLQGQPGAASDPRERRRQAAALMQQQLKTGSGVTAAKPTKKAQTEANNVNRGAAVLRAEGLRSTERKDKPYAVDIADGLELEQGDDPEGVRPLSREGPYSTFQREGASTDPAAQEQARLGLRQARAQQLLDEHGAPPLPSGEVPYRSTEQYTQDLGGTWGGGDMSRSKEPVSDDMSEDAGLPDAGNFEQWLQQRAPGEQQHIRAVMKERGWHIGDDGSLQEEKGDPVPESVAAEAFFG